MASRCSVVMPYYNNARTLMRSLRSFAEQRPQPLELVVVDDGSAEPASAACPQSTLCGVPVRLLRARHGGQSAATNVGIAAAQGELTYLTCPDIVAPRGVLARHLDAHAAAATRGEEVGVMGHIAYAPWLKMTPFLRFLSRPGPQFCYDRITDPQNADPAHLYAPACSVPTARLRAVGGFDEIFTYGYQDTDLGLRLAAAGLRFVYDAQAVVLHDHPNDVESFARRNERVAELTWHLLDKHPDVMPAENLRHGLRAWGRSYAVLPRVRAEAAMLEERLRAAPPGRGPLAEAVAQVQVVLEQRYDGLLTAAFSCGLLRGGEAVRTRLSVPLDEWDQLCGNLLPHSPSATSGVTSI